MPMPTPEPNMDRIQLEQTKFALRQFVAEEVGLNNLELNEYFDEFAHGVIYEFTDGDSQSAQCHRIDAQSEVAHREDSRNQR